jgi:diguanylate cyclase (GGDEF)-like protein/PAS domain S-box-containing protein
VNQELRTSLLQQAIANINEGIVITDAVAAGQPVIYVNPAFEAMTGYAASELLGRNLRFLQRDDHDQPALDVLRLAIQEQRACTVTLRNYRKDGTPFWNELSISTVQGEGGRVTHFIGVHKDVTQRVDADSRLRQAKADLEETNTRLSHQATRDPLTTIGNRRHFEDCMEVEWRRALRARQMLSCFMIDIDYFKRYNDAYGHQAGDRCLRQVAGAVEESFRRGSDLVARYGGEEFVALAAGLTAEDAIRQARSLCQRVEALALPHRDSQAAGMITVSVGVASLVPAPGNSAADLIAAADGSLYRAKAEGRNRAVQASAKMG